MEITMEFSFVGNPLFRQTIQVFKSSDQSASNAYYQRMSVSVACPPPPIARSPPRSCPSPDEAVAEIRDALGSIGGTSPECPSNV
jgi:hypothetical protein